MSTIAVLKARRALRQAVSMGAWFAFAALVGLLVASSTSFSPDYESVDGFRRVLWGDSLAIVLGSFTLGAYSRSWRSPFASRGDVG